MRVTYKRISRIRALRLAAGMLSTELSVTVHDRGMLLQTYGPLPRGRGTCLRRYKRVALGGMVRGRGGLSSSVPGDRCGYKPLENKESG